MGPFIPLDRMNLCMRTFTCVEKLHAPVGQPALRSSVAVFARAWQILEYQVRKFCAELAHGLDAFVCSLFLPFLFPFLFIKLWKHTGYDDLMYFEEENDISSFFWEGGGGVLEQNKRQHKKRYKRKQNGTQKKTIQKPKQKRRTKGQKQKKKNSEHPQYL